jgi:flagellar biosynthesis protein FliR
MHGEFTFQLTTLFGFLLALARVSGVLAFVPIPGFAAGPDASRIVLALAVTVALSPVWLFPARQAEASGLSSLAGASPLAQFFGPLFGMIFTEALFGVTIGLAVAFLLEGAQMAAQALGLQAGYSYASTVDPTTQADTTTLQLLAQLLAGSLFFAFGFDRRVLSALARSFESAPNRPVSLDGEAVGAIVHLGASIFSTGLQIAMPVLALLILLDIAFAVLGRLHAQLQLLSLSFSIKMLAALAFLAGVLSAYPAILERTGAITFRVVDRIVSR